uniref:Uncharacterized protein n=1 Tax=Micrurus corallinus TaxID=54390 RepID=A0A2D4GD81_MICCO
MGSATKCDKERKETKEITQCSPRNFTHAYLGPGQRAKSSMPLKTLVGWEMSRFQGNLIPEYNCSYRESVLLRCNRCHCLIKDGAYQPCQTNWLSQQSPTCLAAQLGGGRGELSGGPVHTHAAQLV